MLGELMAQVLETQTGATVERRFNLAGTQICFDGLRSGALDVYAEYTGTGLRNILGDTSAIGSPAAVFALVSTAFRERFALDWLAPFGFNNTYVLIMRADRAAALGITTLSDLAAHPLRYGVSHEFLQRPDGMPGLRAAYRLNEASTVGLEHDLAYQALATGAIDVTDGYSTDAKILAFNLVTLRDDRGFFPPYEGAPLARADLFTRVPLAAPALRLLAGRIDDATMRRLNYAVEGERRSAGRGRQRIPAPARPAARRDGADGAPDRIAGAAVAAALDHAGADRAPPVADRRSRCSPPCSSVCRSASPPAGARRWPAWRCRAPACCRPFPRSPCWRSCCRCSASASRRRSPRCSSTDCCRSCATRSPGCAASTRSCSRSAAGSACARAICSGASSCRSRRRSSWPAFAPRR